MIGKLEQVKVMFDCGGESSKVWGVGIEDKATFRRCGEGVCGGSCNFWEAGVENQATFGAWGAGRERDSETFRRWEGLEVIPCVVDKKTGKPVTYVESLRNVSSFREQRFLQLVSFLAKIYAQDWRCVHRQTVPIND